MKNEFDLYHSDYVPKRAKESHKVIKAMISNRKRLDLKKCHVLSLLHMTSAERVAGGRNRSQFTFRAGLEAARK